MKKRKWFSNTPRLVYFCVSIAIMCLSFAGLIFATKRELLWPAVLGLLLMLGVSFWSGWVSIVEFIYRKLAYVYTVETIWAEVVEKGWAACGAGYILSVEFRTADNLLDKIYDAEFYDWAEKGKRFKVTLKVGRTRGARPEPRYWTIVDYSFHR